MFKKFEIKGLEIFNINLSGKTSEQMFLRNDIILNFCFMFVIYIFRLLEIIL